MFYVSVEGKQILCSYYKQSTVNKWNWILLKKLFINVANIENTVNEYWYILEK